MSSYLRYRPRKTIEAKQVNHAFGLFNPRTGQRQQGRAGDYLVREAGQPERIVPQELFRREYEPEADAAGAQADAWACG